MRTRSIAALALGTLAVTSLACESLIGAGFDDYVVEPAGGTAASSTSSTGAPASTSTGGEGGGGDGGGSPATSSSSTGVACEEWPAGSGEWAWATQIGDADGAIGAIEASALVPTDSDTYPWAVVGQLVGTLFAGTSDAIEASRPSPFVVPVGPAGADASTATSVRCSGDCVEVEVRDASADRPTWGDFGIAFWAGGSFSGVFQDLEAPTGDSPFIARFYADERSEEWSPDTTWTTGVEGEADVGAVDAVSAHSSLVAFAGVGPEVTMFGLSEQNDGRFWIGVGLGRYPLLLSRRAGWLGTGVVGNACARNDDVEHQHEIDVALRGETAWVAGRYCGSLVFDGAIGNEPGDGFVVRAHMPESAEPVLELSASPSIVHGSPAIAIAAEDDAAAFLVGEIDPEDLTKSIPGDTSIFATSRDAWIARVDHGADGLTPGWSVQLELPGEQHVHDVAVRRFGGGDDDLDVFVVGSSSERIDLNGYSSSCAPIDGRVGFVASLSGLDGSIRWIRSFGRSQAAAVEVVASDEGVVLVGKPGPGAPTLSPSRDGDGIPLTDLAPSIFVGELTR